MVASYLTELGIDCHNPRRLADFWGKVLGYGVLSDEVNEDVVSIGPSRQEPLVSGASPIPVMLTFARVPEAKVVKNRLHLDIRPVAIEQETEIRRLRELGATLTDVGQGHQSWVVMADPEGNEFCVLSPHEGQATPTG